MTENEISKYLAQGYTPQQVINMGKGFRKSTVYKVHKALRTYVANISPPDWVITNTQFDHLDKRYLSGQKVSVTFNFENTSTKDIYLTRIGMQFEWQKNEWCALDVRDLIKAGQKRFFSIPIPVPISDKIALGEYEYRFGVEAQYLPVMGYQDQLIQTQWSEPEIIHVKYPLRGIKLFISHSTLDIPLIRQLEQYLDNYGIESIIAEDIRTPGEILREKFQAKIREATIFLVLFTENSIRSQWVIEETNYALEIRKPSVLLKEESIKEIKSDIEWEEFSKYEAFEIIFLKIMESIESHLKNIHITPQNNATIGNTSMDKVIGVGVLAFLGGLFLGSLAAKKR